MALGENFYGVYNAYINSIRNNQLDFMREMMPLGLIKAYGEVFTPVLGDIFPDMPAPSKKGEVVGVGTKYGVPYTSDPGMISPWLNRIEELDEYTVGFDEITYQARLTGFAGPTLDKMEFKNEWIDGFLDVRNQKEIAMVMKSIARRKELELVNMCFGTLGAIRQFSPDLTTERLLKIDAVSGKIITDGYGDASPVLTGVNWGDFDNAKPVYDISAIIYHMGDFTGEEAINGFVGNKTAFKLDVNTSLQNYEFYHTDVTQSIIGKSIKNVNLKRVMGQHYKENASVNSGRLNNPGRGTLKIDTWADRVKVPMMRHIDKEAGGDGADPYGANYANATDTTWEWALFTTGIVGTTNYARVFDDDPDPMVPYINEYVEPKFKRKKVDIYQAFNPTIDDYGKMIVLERLVEV